MGLVPSVWQVTLYGKGHRRKQHLLKNVDLHLANVTFYGKLLFFLIPVFLIKVVDRLWHGFIAQHIRTLLWVRCWIKFWLIYYITGHALDMAKPLKHTSCSESWIAWYFWLSAILNIYTYIHTHTFYCLPIECESRLPDTETIQKFKT